MQRAPLLVVVWLLVQSVAVAQSALPREPEVEAGERFARGVELFKEGAFRAALVEFQRAYTTSPDFRLLYNIGRTQLKLQDYLAASQSYERYLREGGTEIAGERRAQVEEALAELRQRVGGIKLVVDRSGLFVLLDDTEVGKTPLASPILTNVGRHRITLRAPDGASAVRTVDVAGNDLIEVAMTLVEPEVRAQGVEARDSWTTPRKLALAGWVTGGLLLAGSAVTGVLALRAEDELDDFLQTRSYSEEEAQDERSAVKALAITSDVLLAVGAATVVSATVLWFVSGGDESRPRDAARVKRTTRLGLGFGQASLTTTF